MYAIMVDYYRWSEEKGDYTEPLYLGLEGKLKIFVFDEEITERTKLFKTAKAAGYYVDKHFGPDRQRICFKSVKIVEVEKGA